jgi:hypothetical protein
MGEALQTAGFSREELTFVTGGEPSPPTAPAEKPKTDQQARRPKARAVVTSAADNGAPDSAPGGTVSMTFRLPVDISKRMLQIALNRKLCRLHPWSQQGIVADALRAWLDSH